MSVNQTILLIIWILLVVFIIFFYDPSVLRINDKEIITNPILKILFTLIVLPIVGVFLVYFGKLLAYPLTYFFKFFI